MAKRPKLVWVVFLFYVLSAAWGALSFALIYSGAVPTTPAVAYFRDVSAFAWAISLLAVLLNLAGAIAIFLLRRIALYFFVTALGLGILQTLVRAITTSFLTVLGGPGAIGALVHYGISLAVCIYAWRLRARGVLV